MYENVSIGSTRTWIADIRTREGALFWTRAAAGFLVAVGGTLVALGMDAVVVGGLVAAWSTFLELLGRQIRADVVSQDTAARLERTAFVEGRQAGGLDVAQPGDMPDGYGTTGGC